MNKYEFKYSWIQVENKDDAIYLSGKDLVDSHFDFMFGNKEDAVKFAYSIIFEAEGEDK